MRKVIFLVALILSFSSLDAAPISSAKIKNEIKKVMKGYIEYHLETVGMDRSVRAGGSHCENIVINRVKILHTSKMKTNRYRYHYYDGNYDGPALTSKFFTVTYKLEGSCKLAYPTYVDYLDRIRRGKQAYKRVFVGRVPIRKDLVFKTIITKTSGGSRRAKWEAYNSPSILTKDSERKRKSYRARLYRLQGKNRVCRILPSHTGFRGVNEITCLYVSDKMKRDYENSKMSYTAERGLKMLRFERHLYTPKEKALMLAQPKKVREYIFGTYYHLIIYKRDKRGARVFIKRVINKLKRVQRR